MSDQNNIDNFFRNRFKDFEASPDPDLWDKISDRLDEKEVDEKKEGIVLLPWLYKAVGIAAAIALLFFVGTKFVSTNDSGIDSDQQTTSTTKEKSSDKDVNGKTNNSQITDSDTNSEQNSLQNKNNTTPEGTLQNKQQIANEGTIDRNNPNKLQNGKDSNVQQGNALQNGIAQQNGTQSNSQNASSNNSIHTNTVQNKNIGNQENAVANTTTNGKDKILTPEQRKRLNGQNYKTKNGEYTSTNPLVKNAVAENHKNGTKNNTTNTVNGKGSEANSSSNAITNENTSAVAQNDTNNSTNTSNTTNTTGSEVNGTANTDATNTETAVADTPKEEKIEKSILDVINDLHDLEKDKTEVAETSISKWTISPNASPVYYNTLGNGSPIDETFADNTKTGDINLSYGLNVGYDISKRLTVRSGIHRVEYSYSTKDIALVPSINGSELTTIQFKNANAAFDIQDRQATTNETFSQYQVPITTESSIQRKQIEGDLSQRMTYVEVPVELKYAVVDKKLGINVIGGVSTLLLTENSIILDSPELLTELGEATNVNDVSFSTNIGLGIDYKFSDQLEFSLEPMLKYQLNAFSGNTGNFNPYSVGVYTGVSFRF
ncbi:hypothetical protein [Kordia sp.]|uniref:hypothetical protein n=1 Tax=Kordia sp. TaxID=1965332 RepID=UPI003D6A33F9